MTSNPQLDELSQGFRGAITGLGEITTRSRIKYEHGDYERIYIKPNYRLGTALLTSRELLVVVAPFFEVQTRVIRLVTEILREIVGRLEPGMAVIVHRDPNGDEHLRQWGREAGLTVLPVYAAEGMPTGDQLEQKLCAGLYKHDPFDLTGPVRLSSQFFGRQYVPDLARRLRDGHIHALFAVRKAGKTSVLHRTIEDARQHHGVACVFADMSDDSLASLEAGRLLNSVCGAVNDAVLHSDERYATVLPLGDSIEPGEAANVFLNTLAQRNTPVLLAMDEIDYITPSSPTFAEVWKGQFNPLFRALRRVYQECALRQIPFSILISGVSSRWFAIGEIDGVENAALALVPENYLPPLERTESILMVETLGRAAGLIFTSTSADKLAATCSDIPFWIRKAGSYINSCYAESERPLRPRDKDIVELLNEFIEVEGRQLAFSSFDHLFRIYPSLGEVAAACLSKERLTALPQPLLSTLGRYGILSEGFDPSGPMVEAGLRHWVEAYPQPSLFIDSAPPTGISAGSSSAAGETEWAELLSEVSRRRNVLERDLREFVLVIVRLECAKANQTRKPSEVLLAALPLERRSELMGASAKAILAAGYWQDLMNTVFKNWPCFEPYFGDRTQVKLYGDIVNDRPDAHAKPIDGAELALQRRAIEWFSDRIAKSGLL